MCLVEFGDDSDVLPVTEPDTTSSQITLTGGFGKMNKRRREAVIQFMLSLVIGIELS